MPEATQDEEPTARLTVAVLHDVNGDMTESFTVRSYKHLGGGVMGVETDRGNIILPPSMEYMLRDPTKYGFG